MELHDSRYSWTRLALSLLIGVIGNIGMWAIIVILPAVQAEFGTNRADASLPYTATMVGFALGNWLIGRVVDRFGLAVSLAGSAVLIAVGYTLASLAPTIGVLTLVQGLIGFGTSVAFGPLIADTSHWFLRHRGIAVGVAASGNYLAGAIWPTLLAGTLAEAGWRSVYETLAIVTILTNPALLLTSLFTVPKLTFALHVFAPLLFLTWRNAWLFAATLGAFPSTLMVTNGIYVTNIGFQYVTHWVPYVFGGAALEFRTGDEAPDEEFKVEATAGIGVDLSLDRARRFVLRASAALGERQAVAVGLSVGGGS